MINTLEREVLADALTAARDALQRLLASDPTGAIANANDADLAAARDDDCADPVIREQAAAVLQGRAALALASSVSEHAGRQPARWLVAFAIAAITAKTEKFSPLLAPLHQWAERSVADMPDDLPDEAFAQVARSAVEFLGEGALR